MPTTHSIPVPVTPDSREKRTLTVHDFGDAEHAAVTTVCVHGLTRNARDFDIIAEALAGTGRRVLTLNMAGRGTSDWLSDPMGYNYGTYVTDCLAVMDNFHLREVEWLGTSMGGLIGMMIASQQPARIKKLVMNDIGALLSKEALARIYAYVSTMPTSFATREQAETYLKEAFAPWGIIGTPLWPLFVKSSLMEKNGKVIYACDPAIAMPLAAATANYTKVDDVNLSEVWKSVEAPTLILHGAQSDILSVQTISAMRAIHIRTESLTFEGVGHAPALMTEEQIHPVIRWLNRNTAEMMAASF